MRGCRILRSDIAPQVERADRQSTDAGARRVRARADLVIGRAALAGNTGEGSKP